MEKIMIRILFIAYSLILIGLTALITNNKDETARGKELEHAAKRADSAAREEVFHQITVERERDWNTLVRALILVESGGDPQAIGDGGAAVGVLQIHPSVVQDVNAVGYNFTLADRADREQSIRIFNAYQDIYNPQHDVHWAIKLHNPRASTAYHRLVIRTMNELKEL